MIHQNKHNNKAFCDLGTEFKLIREVSHKYNQTTESAFFQSVHMALIFYLFSIDP